MIGKIVLAGRYDSSQKSILKLIKELNSQINSLGDFSQLKRLVFDLSDLNYIDSNISVILYAYLKELDNSNYFPIDIIAPLNKQVVNVLLKNNFCSLWEGDALNDDYLTYIKINKCENIRDCVKFNYEDLMPKLNVINMTADDKSEFLASLLEVNANSFQHGKCKDLYVCGQFFPNNHTLNLTFINFGRTFNQNFIGYHKINQLQLPKEFSISWAMQEGNTTDKDSLGLGLSRFLDNLTKYNADVIIISDNEIFCRSNEKLINKTINDLRFMGTILSVRFNLSDKNSINC